MAKPKKRARNSAADDLLRDILCRKFPQLKNAVLVFAHGDFCTWVERTYRLQDDGYLRIRSTDAGSKIVPIKEPVLDMTRVTAAQIRSMPTYRRERH